MRRLEGLVQGAVEPDMEKKGLVRGFLRRDPALTQKLAFLFRKTDTKTYYLLLSFHIVCFLPSSSFSPGLRSFEHSDSL